MKNFQRSTEKNTVKACMQLSIFSRAVFDAFFQPIAAGNSMAQLGTIFKVISVWKKKIPIG
jgi:hypothetical protein